MADDTSTTDRKCATKGDMYCNHPEDCNADGGDNQYCGPLPKSNAPSRSVVTRTINRFRNACEDKAFQGTIPYGESEEAAKACEAVDIEMERAENALRRLIDRNS